MMRLWLGVFVVGVVFFIAHTIYASRHRIKTTILESKVDDHVEVKEQRERIKQKLNDLYQDEEPK